MEHSPSPWNIKSQRGETVAIEDAEHNYIGTFSAADGELIVRCVNSWGSIEALRARLAELES